MTRLEGPLADPQSGAWIAARLAQAGTVSGTVPQGYAAYARIFHPIRAQLLDWRPDGPVTVESRNMRWEELAEARGTVAHPLMQWSAILAGYRNPVWNERGWHYEDPLVGALPAGTLAEVVRLLAAHTQPPGRCLAGLWDGWGWVTGAGETSAVSAGGPAPQEALPLPGYAAADRVPRLELPARDYLLFTGDLAVFADPGWQERNGWDPLQSPNLLWPQDAAWFLASEIDFDSTLVGGSVELITDLLQAGTFEAMAVPLDGDLTRLGDLRNETPD
ncbi:hypothetical protein N2K95_08055 [Arthrobacter zhaoxinii]|uniref:Uncharacterized protein n=1 Tax=Arthrobacter zhaoxinii TaxID=2964616 RepID=A0ABY5YUW1_9MICC|nr:hypothetical protein [Arthrobacter zhaoxinii]UWX98582.1 hypothetical protein N2K95_08055 [Arthrobacter zhaoxinii]